MRFALIAHRSTATNDALVSAARPAMAWERMAPREALARLRPGDVALGRLDVRATLDGIEPGLWALAALASRGVVVLNDHHALLAAHDKLVTARLLRRHGVPHPETRLIREGDSAPGAARPVVVKPRFGSWGREVVRCDGDGDLRRALAAVSRRSWFRAQGALVQDLVPPSGSDLRLVVAAGRVVGAVRRIAAPGEWRTNVALGAARCPVAAVPAEASALATRAARACGAALAGVDILPTPTGAWVVLEVNGAVELTAEYGLRADVFSEISLALARSALDGRRPRAAFAVAAA